MRKTHLLLAALAVFALSERAVAQETKDFRVQFGVGLGVSINAAVSETALISPLPITAFWAPIQLGEFIRIEPEFGVFSVTTRSEGRRGTETVTATNTSTLLRFGAGAFYTLNLQPVRSYFGVRVGFPSISQSLEQTGRERQTRTQNGFTVAPTLGGEYLFSDRFTLGGEVQLPFSNISAPNVGGQPEAERVNSAVLSTAVYVTVRWFFN